MPLGQAIILAFGIIFMAVFVGVLSPVPVLYLAITAAVGVLAVAALFFALEHFDAKAAKANVTD
jgi:hypothetical protein